VVDFGDWFSVSVLAYNKREFTERCLNSLLDGIDLETPTELILVNNGSTDDTVIWAQGFQIKAAARGVPFRIVNLNENRGVSAGFNAGIQAATPKSKWIGILNNDTWLMPGWNRALIREIQRLNVDMLSPSYDERPFDPSPERMKERARIWISKNRNRTKKRWGSIFMVFNRKVFEKIGLWDERFFCTSEDADFRHRMELAGLKYQMSGNCYCWHYSKGTRGDDPKNYEYEIEGRKIFKNKWGFDPIDPEHTIRAKLTRKWDRILKKLGYF
jgi:GT2 family glycosyltransferase